MAPVLIIPASFFGFIAAVVRFWAFHVSFTEAAMTYFLVAGAAAAVMIWAVKTVELRHNIKDDLALPAR